MILGIGRAAGKVILFGEHAVVYGRPTLAVPVTQVAAEATVEPAAPGAGLTIWAADLGERVDLRTAPADHPLAAAARLALAHLGLPEPDWRVTVRSTIPIASGMGSGAAVSAAILARWRRRRIANQRISEWANQRSVSSHSSFAISYPAIRIRSLPPTSPRSSTRSNACTTAHRAGWTTPSSRTASRSISCAGSRRRPSRSAGRSRSPSRTAASPARPRSRWGTCGWRGSAKGHASRRCSTGWRPSWRPRARPLPQVSRSDSAR